MDSADTTASASGSAPEASQSERHVAVGKQKHHRVVDGERGKPRTGEPKKGDPHFFVDGRNLSLTRLAQGGAGGKGTWGKAGDELRVDGRTVDPHDPNYAEEDEDLAAGRTRLRSINVSLAREELYDLMKPCIQEVRGTRACAPNGGSLSYVG